MQEGKYGEALERVAKQFRHFAEVEFHRYSPLYERLSYGIAEDAALLALAGQAKPGQPMPNMLLGAVQYLLMKDPTHPLAAFYPGIASEVKTDGDPFPLFQDFCREHREAIEQIIQTRSVQTNEVRRCSLLLPAFALVASRERARPLALVEIGPSAGLNLLWDRYAYQYQDERTIGSELAAVQLACEVRGERQPPLPEILPTVASRIGIDLHPIDVRDKEATLWLEALIWPEHTERRALLQKALQAAQQDPPPLVCGNALECLQEILRGLPTDAAPCIYHSFVLYQFSEEDRERLDMLLMKASSRGRFLYRIGIEGVAGPSTFLELTTYRDGERTRERLAHCHAHGLWMEWLSASPL